MTNIKMLVNHEISFILSSDPANGAVNRTANGDYYEVQLQEPLEVPKEAINCLLTVQESTVWWTIPNIITGTNDTMYVTGPDTLNVLTNYVVVIPQGLYDLNGLNTAILSQLSDQGAKISPYNLISLSPDSATQKVNIRFNYNTVSISFVQTNTFRDILGFNNIVYGPYALPQTTLAPNTANFNTINYFLIHSDLTSRGLRFNNKYNQSISTVLINVSPGSQIVSTPFNPSTININELIGQKRTNIRMWITDDKDRSINMNGEFWSCRVVIKYFTIK
jgi:hypothetical protein